MTPHRRQLLGAAPLLAETRAWSAAVGTAGGGVSSARLRLVNRLIQSLKSAGVWTSLDRLWLFAAENSTAALVDLVARATATAVNSPAFTADRQYAFNGTTNYIDSGFAPGTHAVRMTGTSMGLWTYERVDVDSPGYSAGCYDGVNQHLLLRPRANGTTFSGFANSGSVAATVGDSLGFSGVTWDGTEALLWRNGAVLPTSAATNPGSVLPTRNVFVGGYNDGALQNPGARSISAMALSARLTAAQALGFHNAVQAYMTAVGAS